jgi:hypothetical protein
MIAVVYYGIAIALVYAGIGAGGWRGDATPAPVL